MSFHCLLTSVISIDLDYIVIIFKIFFSFVPGFQHLTVMYLVKILTYPDWDLMSFRNLVFLKLTLEISHSLSFEYWFYYISSPF